MFKTTQEMVAQEIVQFFVHENGFRRFLVFKTKPNYCIRYGDKSLNVYSQKTEESRILLLLPKHPKASDVRTVRQNQVHVKIGRLRSPSS